MLTRVYSATLGWLLGWVIRLLGGLLLLLIIVALQSALVEGPSRRKWWAGRSSSD